MPTALRLAVSADIPAMSRIRLAVAENKLSDPARITQQMYEDYLQKLGRGWVAEVDGVIAGFCYANSQDASIWALFMAREYEGRGIARQLLDLAVAWLFAQGCEAVRLSTGANTRADGFYARQGWTLERVENKEAFYVLNNTVTHKPRPASPSDSTISA
ncbi:MULTISPECIES: GNAT family N-acetyltransferase [unclassified Duganella]|uniref:GNAT family N-acetyltransferase n=1 Tax=unclassified Duganella TaxID=2636909 RepID=UPI00088C581F|nr:MULTISPECIES: GNAT family N-acetyltransferase [unclassified Duganella]SDG78391.1 Acetyltransferase (GNAT) domain-containing protein [Duganella sp. OV458]SDK05359.1 Acetyltransferase (GNAT) family protein [Duganella sp. OV510]